MASPGSSPMSRTSTYSCNWAGALLIEGSRILAGMRGSRLISRSRCRTDRTHAPQLRLSEWPRQHRATRNLNCTRPLHTRDHESAFRPGKSILGLASAPGNLPTRTRTCMVPHRLSHDRRSCMELSEWRHELSCGSEVGSSSSSSRALPNGGWLASPQAVRNHRPPVTAITVFPVESP